MICKFATLYTNVIVFKFITLSNSLLHVHNNNFQQSQVNGRGGEEPGPSSSRNIPSEMSKGESDGWQTWFPFSSRDDTDFSLQTPPLPPRTGRPPRKSCPNLYETGMFVGRLIEVGMGLTEEIQVCGEKLEGESSKKKKKRQIKFSTNMDTTRNNANYNDHPWSVLLKICFTIRIQYKIFKTGEIRHVMENRLYNATGSVIHKHFILTAAHVLPEGNIPRMQRLIDQRDTETITELRYIIHGQDYNINGKIDILSVELDGRYRITMFMGPLRINKDTFEVIETDASRKISIDNTNQMYTRICPRFVTGGDKCDIGLIFLDDSKKLSFHGSNIRPVCLPGYSGEEHEYQTCAPLVGDQFVVAGYGWTQDYIKFEEKGIYQSTAYQSITNPVGLNQAYCRVYELRFSKGKDARAEIDATVNPNQMLGDAKVIGIGGGDSGAAWTFQRDTSHGKEVAMQLGLQSGVRQKRITNEDEEITDGANLMFYTEWIVDAMLKLWKQNH